MGVPFAKIEELIEIAKECDRKLPEDEKKIHVLDIAATLQKLIDDELADLEKTAQEFIEQETYFLEEETMITKQKADWPHGL